MTLAEIFLKPLTHHKRWLTAIALSLVVLALAQGLLLMTVGPFLKALFAPATNDVIPLTALLPENLLKLWPEAGEISLKRITLSWAVPLTMGIAGLAQAIAAYVYQLHQQMIALYVAKFYREQLFEALLGQSYTTIAARSPGRWMSIIMNDVLYLQTRFADILSSFVKDIVLVLGCLIAIAALHWQTAVALLIFCPFVAWGMGRAGGRIAGFAHEWQLNLGTMASAILDVRRRLPFIRAQSGEGWEEERFRRLNDHYYRSIRRSIFLRSAFAPVVEFLGFVIFAAFIALSTRTLWLNHLGPAELIQFFAALGLLLRPLRNLGEQLTRLQETRGSLQDSLGLLQARSATTPTSAEKPQVDLPATIQLDRISAGYDSLVFTFQDLNFSKGKSIALIGPSGAGKSTLLKTLAGLVTPESWQGNIDAATFSANTALVSQTPFLFTDALKANLLYGSDSSKADTAIWSALEQVHLDATVKALPERLATTFDAMHPNLSGGQIQRLVIARALLANKSIWLFDEATSAIDAETEKDITLGAIALCRSEGKILLNITHRLGWLHAFDEVWFLEEGEIKLRGAHGDLMANERYRQFLAVESGEKLSTSQNQKKDATSLTP